MTVMSPIVERAKRRELAQRMMAARALAVTHAPPLPARPTFSHIKANYYHNLGSILKHFPELAISAGVYRIEPGVLVKLGNMTQESACLAFAKRHTTIPLPRVLHQLSRRKPR